MDRCSRVNVILLFEAEIASTQLVERVLQTSRFSYEKYVISDYCRLTDCNGGIPLIIRSAEPETVSLVKHYVVMSTPFVYYIDDNFWEINDGSLLAKYYQHPTIQYGLEYIVTHASTVLCNSLELAKFIERKFRRHVAIVPPMFDFSLVKNVERYSGEEIRIGFAGSESRKKDIGFISEVIPIILDKYENVVFEFAGVIPDGVWLCNRVRYHSAIKNYSDFIRLQYSRGWIIGLAPLSGSVSDNYKTNNKFREYSACKTVGVYSDSPSYSHCVIDKVNGMVCRSLEPSEWIDKITYLIDSPISCASMSKNAYQFVKDNYDVEVISACWHDVLYEAGKIKPRLKFREFPVFGLIKRVQWKVFLYKIRCQDVYKINGLLGLIRHIMMFIIKKGFNKDGNG